MSPTCSSSSLLWVEHKATQQQLPSIMVFCSCFTSFQFIQPRSFCFTLTILLCVIFRTVGVKHKKIHAVLFRKKEKAVTTSTIGWYGKDRDNLYQKIYKENIFLFWQFLIVWKCILIIMAKWYIHAYIVHCTSSGFHKSLGAAPS